MTPETVLVLSGGDAVTDAVVLIEPPAPCRPPVVRAVDPPAALAPHEIIRLRAAAYLAPRRYPGPIGELVARELLDWSEFGFRFGRRGLVGRLVDEVMSAPPPADSARCRQPSASEQATKVGGLAEVLHVVADHADQALAE